MTKIKTNTKSENIKNKIFNELDTKGKIASKKIFILTKNLTKKLIKLPHIKKGLFSTNSN